MTRVRYVTPFLFAAIVTAANGALLAGEAASENPTTRVLGLTGKVSDVRTAVEAAETVKPLAAGIPRNDINLKRMAEWALNYLIKTPRKNLGYQPVFQCHPLACPPVPAGDDPVVACDTDARMDWEWYYMREISQSASGKEVEAAFHRRIRDYVQPDGQVYATPGAFHEDLKDIKWQKKDMIFHLWGASKILKSLSEDYIRTQNPESKELAKKVMLALKKIAVFRENGCYFPCGMGAMTQDGKVVPNGWNSQPCPLVEPLLTYYLAMQDPLGLEFAKANADGMMNNLQPDGIRFQADGRIRKGGFSFGAHTHATMHAIWGIAHLGILTKEAKYIDFAKGYWDSVLEISTGTGWAPAGPRNCNETCAISDIISVAALIAESGHPEYFDYAERCVRNYISNLQFIVTPEFEAYYRKLNQAAGEVAISNGLQELRKFQGGVIGGSGLNDYENEMLGGVSGFEMFGCCAPEGMRAIYTAWTNTIQRRDASALGPAGVYVNLSFSRESKWGDVVSFMPDSGRLTVKASARDTYYLRVPHWAQHDKVRAFVGDKSTQPVWAGAYVRFEASAGDELTLTYPLPSFKHEVEGICPKITFYWLGNMVTASDPKSTKTSLFSGRPRQLPVLPEQ